MFQSASGVIKNQLAKASKEIERIKAADPSTLTDIELAYRDPKTLSKDDRNRQTEFAMNFAGTTGAINDTKLIAQYGDDAIMAANKVLKSATKNQPYFEKMIENFAKILGVEHEVGPIKGADRILEKVANDYSGDFSQIKDLNRGVIFLENLGSKADDAIAQAKSVFGDKLVRIKANNGENDMYKKIMINVKGEEGLINEIQVTTRKMWKAKTELGGDKLYQRWRSIPENSNQAKKTWQEMEELYKKAI